MPGCLRARRSGSASNCRLRASRGRRRYTSITPGVASGSSRPTSVKSALSLTRRRRRLRWRTSPRPTPGVEAPAHFRSLRERDESPAADVQSPTNGHRPALTVLLGGARRAEHQRGVAQAPNPLLRLDASHGAAPTGPRTLRSTTLTISHLASGSPSPAHTRGDQRAVAPWVRERRNTP